MLDSQVFKDLLSKLPTAVFVIGIEIDNEIVGCTISSIASLDVEKNQKILFTLGKQSKFGTLITEDRTISVNLLNPSQIPQAIHFAGVHPEFGTIEKFNWNKKFTNKII